MGGGCGEYLETQTERRETYWGGEEGYRLRENQGLGGERVPRGQRLGGGAVYGDPRLR